MTDSASRKLKVNKYCVLIAYSLKRASWAYPFRYDSPALFPQKKYNYGHIINWPCLFGQNEEILIVFFFLALKGLNNNSTVLTSTTLRQ